MPPKIQLTGQRFGNLVVIRDIGRSKRGLVNWLCRCDCGSITTVPSNNLRTGNTQSCGCVRGKPPIIHGHCLRSVDHHGTTTYQVWMNMRQRCENAYSTAYKYYGARGIAVCDRWHEFSNFLADMGERPKGLSIDRIDNDGNYEPHNCRWATHSQQMKNRGRKPR